MNVALVGCGGIGSWAALVLGHLIAGRQLVDAGEELDTENITVFDNDIVERKNLKHQLYYTSEVGMPKSVLVANRTGFKGEYRRFVESDLRNFEYFLLAVDNSQTRKMVYEYATAAGVHFIDMRAEGRDYSIFTHVYGRGRLMASLGAEPDSARGFSCQLASDVVVNQVNMGNMGVAPAGMQLFLDDLRGIPIPGMTYVRLNRENQPP